MDLNTCDASIELRQYPGQQREARPVHPVRGAMQQNGMKAGVTEEDFQDALGGWIPVENGIDLFPYHPKHTALL
jgi:hypothetical protein